MTEEQKQGEPVNLNDIAVAVGAIDIAAKAGVYNIGDYEVIGKAHKNLSALVQAAQPQEETPAEEPPVVDAEVVEEAAAE